MNNEKRTRGGKLLAAMAVLAVAFVVLAALPAALSDNDAAAATRNQVSEEIDWQITATTSQDDLDKMKAGGDIYISASNGNTLTLEGGSVIYMTADAKIKLSVADGIEVKFYVAASYDAAKKTVKYYDDSAVTVSNGISVAVSMENGGYAIAGTAPTPVAGKDKSEVPVQLNLVKATYGDRTVSWTYAMLAQKNLTLNLTENGKNGGVKELAIGVPTTKDENQFTLNVTDGTDAVKISGALLSGTAEDMKLEYNGTALEISKNGNLEGGSIERTKGVIDVNNLGHTGNSPADGSYPYLSNGVVTGAGLVVGTADSKLDDLKKYSSYSTLGRIHILQGTEFTEDFEIVGENAKTSYVTIPKGLKTGSYTIIALNDQSKALEIKPGSDALYSQPQWTGGTIVVGNDDATPIKKIALSGAIGSLTLKSYKNEAVQVTLKEGAQVWGNLKIQDNSVDSHSECNQMIVGGNAVLASSGSIELAQDVSMVLEGQNTTSFVALGQVYGKGKIVQGNEKIYTLDGSKSNITVQNAAELTIESGAASKTVSSVTSEIDRAAALGYTKADLNKMAISQSYTFPEGIEVTVKDLLTITGIKDSETVVTVPASTILNLGKDSYTGVAVLIGNSESSGYATLVCEGDVIGTGKIDGYGAFSLGAGGNIQGIDTNGKGVFLATETVSGTMKTLKSSEIALSIPYPMYQKVVVEEGKTLTISAYQTSTWYGELQVDGTLIIDRNASAVFGMSKINDIAGSGAVTYMPQAAKITVSSTGTVEVRSGAVLDLNNADASFAGKVKVDGKLIMRNDSGVALSGQLDQSSTGLISGNADSSHSKISVSSTGKLNLGGFLVEDVAGSDLVIKNAGSVVIQNGGINNRSGSNNTNMGSATISLTGSEATVLVDSYMVENANGGSSSLKINDTGVSLAKFDEKEYKVSSTGTGIVPVAVDNRIVITGSNPGTKVVGPLTVASAVEQQISLSEIDVTNSLQISGSLSATAASGTTPAASVEVTSGDEVEMLFTEESATYKTAKFNGSIVVPEDKVLTVGTKVSLMNTKMLEVDGYLDMTAADVTPLNNSGDVEVQGKIKINSKPIAGNGEVHAAEFISKEKVGTATTATEFYNYMALDKAVSEEGVLNPANENNDKTVTIHGWVYLLRNLNVPAPVKLVFDSTDYNKDKLFVGDENNSDVLLDFDKGTEFTSAKYQVEVYGTMHFDDKSNDATVKTMCDVKVESDDGTEREYTNIYTALGSAKSGDTVEVTREPTNAEGGSAFVTLNRPVAVGEGVTLKDASTVAPLYLEDGATLTVNGVLDTENHVYAETCFDAAATKDSSAIIVNGLIKSNYALNYVYVPATGGYARLADGAPISGAYYRYDSKYCLSTVEIAEDVFQEIQGTEMQVFGPVTAGDLSFSKGKTCSTITVSNASTVSKQAKQTSFTAASIELDEVKITVDSDAYLNATVKNESGSVVVSKLPGIILIEKDGNLIVQGNAAADKASVLTIASGTVVAGSNQGVLVYAPAVKDGKEVTGASGMTVASGATLQSYTGSSISEITVNGTLDVVQGNDMEVGVLYDYGTVRAFAGDQSAGVSTLKIADRAYIGTDAKAEATYAARLSGTIDVSDAVVVVRNGATVDSVAQGILDKLNKTEYYVDGSLWITVYDGTAAELIYAYKEPVIQNAYFSGWSDKQSGDQIPEKSKKTIGDYSKVYALINKAVYHVIIKADQGIGDLYLNGNIMSKGMLLINDGYYYAYWADIESGTYQVTCKLANGYSGVAQLKYTDGKDVPNSKFTAQGTPLTSDGITLEFQLTGIEKSGYYVPTEKEDDSGLTLSDYLLIVLVVLVVVLAVVVALRMLRS